MVQNGKLIVPLVFWSTKPPNLSITTVACGLEDGLVIFGTTSGHVILCHYNEKQNVMSLIPIVNVG